MDGHSLSTFDLADEAKSISAETIRLSLYQYVVLEWQDRYRV